MKQTRSGTYALYNHSRRISGAWKLYNSDPPRGLSE